MPRASRPLKLREGLPWAGVLIRSKDGLYRYFPFVLDSGTAHTVLHLRTARMLGFTKDDKVGTATFDAIGHSEPADTIRLSSLVCFGRDMPDYLVGVVEFQSKVSAPGILGLDFFAVTDLLLGFRRGEVVLEW